MNRPTIAQLFNDAWTEGLWAASWSKSLDGLTPQQAAWKPAPGRHSIWQIVAHMLFWREDALGRLAGRPQPTEAEVAKLNFPDPSEPTAAAWEELRRRFAASQQAISAKLADPAADVSRLTYMLPHDCYHFGQINYLRALQGLKPIE